MSMKGRLMISMELVSDVWICTAEIVSIDPTRNPNITFGVLSSLSGTIATKYPNLLEKWKELMKETCQHVAGEINNRKPEQQKIYGADKLDQLKDQN